MPKRSAAQRQAIAIRDLAAREAEALSKVETKTTEDRVNVARCLRDLTQTWNTACDRLRILSGKPLPGSVKQVAKVKTKTGAPLAFPILPGSNTGTEGK